jgi:uncharacterized surface protein with fasciclin (FAS1) repeats
MKTEVLNMVRKTRVLQFALVIGLAVSGVSCEKPDSDAAARSYQANESSLALKNGSPAPGTQSIGAIAIGAGFTELLNALMYVDDELNTELVDLFMIGKDQHTVFVPTDAAFQDLYTAYNVADITGLPASLVHDVLLYHIVNGRRATNSVVPPVKPKKIPTLLGVSFFVDKNSVITAVGNTANIITPDITASNGIIHIIDEVLLPVN